jgi:ubiquinone/menaquinone biosynthesis C-methylase UbiE
MKLYPKKSVHEAIFEDGAAYERFMGRWSRLTGQLFVDWLQIQPHAKWLDVGCGTGAFSDVILSACTPSTILAFDPSRRHIDFARSRINDDRVQFKVGDATAIDARDGEFDVAAAALVLNFMSAPGQAVKEMRRVVRRGGTVAAYVWDFAGRRNISQHLMNAVSAIAPDAMSPALKPGSTSRKALAELFGSAGLEQIETTNLDIAATLTDFEDYWTSNTDFRSPTANVCRSLPPSQLQAVQQRLRNTLPRGENGKIVVCARALAVQGIVRLD